MYKVIYILFFLFIGFNLTKAQPIIWSDGFEAYDSLTLPPGWTKWNNTPYKVDPFWNWTVRDSGSLLPGVNEIRRAKAHTGRRSIGVSWWTGVNDTITSLSDAWLVTRRISNVPSDALFSYWATGGTPTLRDSLQIWVSTTDSTPSAFLSNPGNFRERILFLPNPIYGVYEQHFIDLSPFAGQTIFIGFRYYMNVSLDGVFVQLDDVELAGTVGINPTGTTLPSKFSLNQNYPNPFNPTTRITFDLARNTNVKLIVINSLGQEVLKIFEGYQPAGSYEAQFDGSALSSGTYFYRLETDYFTETKKMQLIK